MNLTRRGLFGSIIASLAGLFVAVKHGDGVNASTTKPKPPSFYGEYPRTYTFVYDPMQPVISIVGDGSVTQFTYDGSGRLIKFVSPPGG